MNEHAPNGTDALLKEIRKTGFPLELKVSATLQNLGFFVLNNPAYLDINEKKSREIDMRASRMQAHTESPQYDVYTILFVECKRSDKPWIFFTSPNSFRDTDTLKIHHYTNIEGLLELSIGGPRPIITEDHLFQHHPYYRVRKKGRTFYEAFKGLESGTRSPHILSAVTSATKAVLYDMGKIGAPADDVPVVVLFYPVIVFEGPLYECYIDEAGEPSLQKADYIQLVFNYVLPEPMSVSRGKIRTLEFVVDVVAFPYLRGYIQQVLDFHEFVDRFIGENFDIVRWSMRSALP